MSDLSGLPGTVPANDDPRNSANYRTARAVAIGLGVLMVLMFLVVVATLVSRIFSSGKETPAVQGAAIDQLPLGSRITDLKIDSGHVVLRIHSNKGEEIRIIDEESGRVVTRIVAPK